MQKNQDLPASPVHPIQDKFGQVILLTGFTKQEKVALEILKILITKDIDQSYISDEDGDSIYNLLSESYFIAEKFCEYLENKGIKQSGIIKNV